MAAGDAAPVEQEGTLMRTYVLAGMAACLLAGAASHAQAQQQPGFTPQELDRMSQERTEVFGPVKHGPPVPQSEVPRQQTYPPSELWLCKGTAAWQPIYSQPSLSSPVMAKTMDMIAVGGRNEGDFARTLLPSGRIGWVPAGQIHDYVNQFNPQATCQINAVRANGGPIYTVR